jgi:hypothetical protein
MAFRSNVNGFLVRLIGYHTFWLFLKLSLLCFFWDYSTANYFDFLPIWKTVFVILELGYWGWGAKIVYDWKSDEYSLETSEIAFVALLILSSFYISLIVAAYVFGVFEAGETFLRVATSVVTFANGNAANPDDIQGNEMFFLVTSVLSYLMLALMIVFVITVFHNSHDK